MVTASLVEPGALNADSPVPGSTYVPPTDWELYSQGRIEGQAAGKLSAADAQALRESGLGRLRGPGSWADWDSPAAPASASGAATASVTGVTPTPAPEATKPKPTTAP